MKSLTKSSGMYRICNILKTLSTRFSCKKHIQSYNRFHWEYRPYTSCKRMLVSFRFTVSSLHSSQRASPISDLRLAIILNSILLRAGNSIPSNISVKNGADKGIKGCIRHTNGSSSLFFGFRYSGSEVILTFDCSLPVFNAVGL